MRHLLVITTSKPEILEAIDSGGLTSWITSSSTTSRNGAGSMSSCETVAKSRKTAFIVTAVRKGTASLNPNRCRKQARSEQARGFAKLDALQGQQLALDRQAAAVTGEAAVRADDAMAGNDHRDGVAAIRKTDGAHGVGIAESPRDLAVAHRAAIGNLAQRIPHALLEGRAFGCQRQVELAPLAAEIFLQLANHLREPLRPFLAIRGRLRWMPALREADACQGAVLLDEDEIADRARHACPVFHDASLVD